MNAAQVKLFRHILSTAKRPTKSMNEVKDLNAMSDAEVSEAFALEVAGWRRHRMFGDEVRWSPPEEDAVTEYDCPDFATDATNVLPWLDKCSAWQMSREANQYHRASVHPESPGKWFFAVGATFPRAACCALIAARRAAKEATP